MSQQNKKSNKFMRNYNEMINNSINNASNNENESFIKNQLFKSALKFGGPINQDLIIHHNKNVRKSMGCKIAQVTTGFDIDSFEKEQNEKNSGNINEKNENISSNSPEKQKLNIEELNDILNRTYRNDNKQIHFGNFYSNKKENNNIFLFNTEKKTSNLGYFFSKKNNFLGERRDELSNNNNLVDEKSIKNEKINNEIKTNINENNSIINNPFLPPININEKNEQIIELNSRQNSSLNKNIKNSKENENNNNNSDENPFLAISKNEMKNPFEEINKLWTNTINNNNNSIINPFNPNNDNLINPFSSSKKNPFSITSSNNNLNSNNEIKNPFIQNKNSNNPFISNINSNNEIKNPFIQNNNSNNPFISNINSNNEIKNPFIQNNNSNNPFISNINNSNNNINPFRNQNNSNNIFSNNNTNNENDSVNPFINYNNNPFNSNNYTFLNSNNQVLYNETINDDIENKNEENNVEEEIKIEKDENKLKSLKEVKYEIKDKFYEIQIENLQYLDCENNKNKYISIGAGLLSFQEENNNGKKIGIFILRDTFTKNIKIQGKIIDTSSVEKAKLKNGLEFIMIKNILATYSKYDINSISQETKLTFIRIRVDKDNLETFFNKAKEFFELMKK